MLHGTILCRYSSINIIVAHHHHWAAVVSRGWTKASACRLQVTLSCAVLCHIVSLQYLSKSSPSFGWSPLSSFLVIWSPIGDTRGPSVVFEAVDMHCPVPLNFITLLVMSMTFVLSVLSHIETLFYIRLPIQKH